MKCLTGESYQWSTLLWKPEKDFRVLSHPSRRLHTDFHDRGSVSHWTVSIETVPLVIKIQENRLLSTGVREGRGRQVFMKDHKVYDRRELKGGADSMDEEQTLPMTLLNVSYLFFHQRNYRLPFLKTAFL